MNVRKLFKLQRVALMQLLGTDQKRAQIKPYLLASSTDPLGVWAFRVLN